MSKISAIIPTYNSSKTIAKVILSIINQVEEIIVVDDCSKDATVKIVENLKKLNKKIILIKNKNRLGLSGSIREGLKYTSNEFVLILHDDIIFPDKNLLRKALNYYLIHSKKDKNIVGISFFYFVPDNIFRKYTFFQKLYSLTDYLFGKNLKNNISISYYAAAGKALLLPKHVIKKLDLYNNPILKFGGEDIEIEIKLKNNNLKLINMPYVFHIHVYKQSDIFYFLKKTILQGKISGTLTRLYGVKISKTYPLLIKIFLYFGILLPKINFLCLSILLLIYVKFLYKTTRYLGFNKFIIFLPFYKLSKDICLIYGFLYGFMRCKQ